MNRYILLGLPETFVRALLPKICIFIVKGGWC